MEEQFQEARATSEVKFYCPRQMLDLAENGIRAQFVAPIDTKNINILVTKFSLPFISTSET